MKNVVKEVFALQRGTKLFLDNGEQVTTYARRQFFYHGVEITYNVIEKKETFSTIDILHINYANVLENVCRLNGFSPAETKQIKSAYEEAGGNLKIFNELCQVKDISIVKRLFFGYNYLRNGYAKLDKSVKISWKAVEEAFDKFDFLAYKKLYKNPYDWVGNYMDFLTASNIFYLNGGWNYTVRDKMIAQKLIEMIKTDRHSYLSTKALDEKQIRYNEADCSNAAIVSAMKEDYSPDMVFPDRAEEEKSLASYIKKHGTGFSSVTKEKINEFRAVLKTEGTNLSSGQEMALDIASYTGTICLTGGPGTGKTTVVKNVLRVIEENIHNVVIKLAAPTGKAAQRLSESSGREAVTVHRLIEMDYKGSCRRNEKRKLEVDVLVVDEASMLDTSLSLKLYKALPEKCLLILVGDVNQLPPVEAGQVFSDLIQSGTVPVYRLYETMRQAGDSVLLTNINRIRDYHDKLIEKEGEFEQFEFESPSKMAQNLLNRAVKEYRERGLMGFQLLVARHEGATGTILLNSQLQSILNPNKAGVDDPFVKGDKIIFTKNNYKAGYVNGDVGLVVDNSNTGITVDIVNGKTVTIPVEDYKNCDLAYAITVHKSQGSEYPCVIVAFTHEDTMMVTINWFYTAVSRAKRTCYIFKEKGVYPVGKGRRATLLPRYL